MTSAISIHPRPTVAVFEVAGWTVMLPMLAGLGRELLKGFVDPYRPERHYMRGPGPKWRERHGASESRRSIAAVRST